jgi:hypothetical protein
MRPTRIGPPPEAAPRRPPCHVPDPPDYLDDNPEALAEWSRVTPRLVQRRALQGEQSNLDPRRLRSSVGHLPRAE